MAITSDLSRKRLRSASGSSNASGASSPKRALSDSPGPNSFALTSSVPNSQAGMDTQTDIDDYMLIQDEDLSLEKIDLSPSSPGALGPSAPTITPKEKLDTIQQLKSRPLQTGETWYIVSSPWYKQFVSACGGAQVKGAPADEASLGPVDNSPILGSDPTRLSVSHTAEGEHIEFLPQDAWDLLVSWYGQPLHAFPRVVIEEGVAKSKRIELFPVNFKLALLEPANPPPPLSATLSRQTSLSALRKYIREHLKFEPNSEYRVWIINHEFVPASFKVGYTPRDVVTQTAFLFYSSSTPSDLQAKCLQGVTDDDCLVVERKGGHGQWFLRPEGLSQQANLVTALRASTAVVLREVNAPSPPDDSPPPLFGEGSDFFTEKYGATVQGPSKPPVAIASGANRDASKSSGWLSNMGVSSVMTRISQPLKPRGTVGLVNLGNTCFMNSALQCLAHIPELTNYFLSGVYEQELNPDNPLSTGGELARSYGKLLQSLFPPEGTSTASVAPREFKFRLSHHAPSFSGYAQHDTQELLAFLLDGLHEDLNRVLRKPYVENPDWEGGGVQEIIKLAQDFWDGYMKRNDSVIVDLFQGQYKSTLVCPECEKVSITFDPFMYLTLPIPVTKRWKHEMFFVTWDMDRPNYKTVVDLPHSATFRDVKVLLAKWFNSDPDYILSAEIFQYRFYKLIHDHNMVNEFNQNDQLFFYELPVKSGQAPTAQPSPTDPFVCPVFTVSPTRFASHSYRNTRLTNRDTWGYPFFVAIDHGDDETEASIYKAIVNRYQQATRLADQLYRWEEVSPKDEPVATQTPPDNDDGETQVDGDDDMELVATAGSSNAAITIDASNKPTSPTAHLVRGKPKEELFTWTIREGNFTRKDGSGSSWDAGRPADFGERNEEAQANAQANEDDLREDYPPELKARLIRRPTGLLRNEDAIVCEWDHNLQEFYFGDRGIGKDSRWNETETYTDPEQAAALLARQGKEKKAISIEDCLDEFVKEERLGQDDLWYCPRCKDHRQATKKLEIWKVPDVLVVHLKRFSSSRSLRDKIEALVEFPIDGFNLSERVGQRGAEQALREAGEIVESLEVDDAGSPLLYDLFAVDEHMGGLGGGHYRAYCKNEDDGLWYHFDDSHVSKTTPQQSITPYAYLLFYRRRTSGPIGGPTVEKTKAAKLNSTGPAPKEDLAEELPETLDTAKEPEEVISYVEPLLPSFGSSESVHSITMDGTISDQLRKLTTEKIPGSPTSSNGAAGNGSPASESPWSQNGDWTPADRSASLEIEEPFGWHTPSGYPSSSVEDADIQEVGENYDELPVDEIRIETVSDILAQTTQPAKERFEID